MEDIFEELAAASDDDGQAEGNDQGGSGNKDDEAEEANESRRLVQPKRVIVRQPRPKLDPTRLLGPRGIFTIKSSFDNVKFKGKGHELTDLNNILSRLQHWAHRLFPKMTFEDCINRIEELGSKKQIQVNMHKIRNCMIDLDSGLPGQDNDVADDDRAPTPPPEDNAFDQLIAAAAPTVQQSTLTDEQRARMMRNRLLAEERRMARRLAREKELEEQRHAGDSRNISDNSSTIDETNGDVCADTTFNSTHNTPGSSRSDAAKPVESSAKSKNDEPSCVFDDPAPASNNGMDVTSAGEETRVLYSNHYAAGNSSNDQKVLQDNKTALLLSDPAIMGTTDSATGEEESGLLGNSSSSSNAEVSCEDESVQNPSVGLLESASGSPIMDIASAAVTGKARVVCSDSPTKRNAGHRSTSTYGRIEVSESDLMDVEHRLEPSLNNSGADNLHPAEGQAAQSSNDVGKTPDSLNQTPQPSTAVDDAMDVGLAEDWDEAFAEEKHILSRQNQL